MLLAAGTTMTKRSDKPSIDAIASTTELNWKTVMPAPDWLRKLVLFI